MITPDDSERLTHQHPWLYHVVKKADEESRATVASDGLAPGRSRRRWHPMYRPRAGHVYLATHSYLTEAVWNLYAEGDDLYAVSTRHLLAQRVNPDEDHFSCDVRIPNCDRVGLLRPPCDELWTFFGSAVLPSYGEWAEAVDLGSDPKHVGISLRHGSIAYNGVVPPKALRRWDETQKAWL